jgi:hypothetical protein
MFSSLEESVSSTRRWIVSRASWLLALFLGAALLSFPGAGTARAQDWTDYLHWPYVPPQTPGTGFSYNSLYDRFHLYPREQRIVPQIQGPYYRNFYGGYRILGLFRPPNGQFDWSQPYRFPLEGWEWDNWTHQRWYEGYHFYLDIF